MEYHESRSTRLRSQHFYLLVVYGIDVQMFIAEYDIKKGDTFGMILNNLLSTLLFYALGFT